MNDQPLIDGYRHIDPRRTRSAMQSIIPVETGLARGIERILPDMAGKVDAKAIRVPTANVCALDMVLCLERGMRSMATAIDTDFINRILEEAAATRYAGLMTTTRAAHASIDFNHDPHAAIVDTGLTRVTGEEMLNLFVWFDNEWGFANRLLDIARDWLPRCTPLAGNQR
jgi:glyceraldehyde 3-phosphate dehydrogenase/D-erythrose 4-phosphate dehydrogenase